MINPCMVHWKAFIALGVFIGGLCAFWGRVVYDLIYGKVTKNSAKHLNIRED